MRKDHLWECQRARIFSHPSRLQDYDQFDELDEDDILDEEEADEDSEDADEDDGEEEWQVGSSPLGGR